MPNKFVSVANGLKIAFGKSGFEADIVSVSHSGVARALIETSHMGTPEPGDGEIGGKTLNTSGEASRTIAIYAMKNSGNEMEINEIELIPRSNQVLR